ncbi:FixH family protein [Neisseria dumasiana]|nr:FixH family protein [Neisseria dumasiana]
MTDRAKKSKVWYKEPWPWLLMAGPAIVVVAAFYTFYLAKSNSADLVSDDYYKDGKHIDLQLHRDAEALKRGITAQVLISPDKNAAKVFVSGDFDRNKTLNLVLMHPAKKSDDQTVKLQAVQSGTLSGNKAEYNAVFKPLPATHHWYVRVEDTDGKWRVEEKWIENQGYAVNLKAKEKLVDLPASDQ